MDEIKMGQKIIDGKIVSLDDEKIEKLSSISEELKKKSCLLKEKINKKID